MAKRLDQERAQFNKNKELYIKYMLNNIYIHVYKYLTKIKCDIFDKSHKSHKTCAVLIDLVVVDIYYMHTYKVYNCFHVSGLITLD